jgi:cob(I)alamin adenosyltransferase
MRIYTRGGDKGKTTLIGKERRYKDDIRVEAYGTVDEAGAFIGVAISFLNPDADADIIGILLQVQQTLWDVGADLAAVPGAEHVFRTDENAAAGLEPIIDEYKERAPNTKKFVLRGGTTAAAVLHLSCTVVRRAERRVVRLMQEEDIYLPTLKYLNRLSDLLFVLARAINARASFQEVQYVHSPDVFRDSKK